MEYFNAGGGGNVGNASDPYAVIPQQFGNGGLPPPQTAQPFDYENTAPDYETYQQQQAQAQAQAAAQQQQQYRAQAPQQSPTIYYQNQMAAAPGSYFPIHSASEHDFLGPQHPPTATSSGTAGAGGAPYQTANTNKDFIMQHQQRRGNQQQQQGQQQSQTQPQSQPPRQQNQMISGTSNNVAQHFMQQQMQHQAAVQQLHRLQGAPINPQQFMVPPPAILQTGQVQGAPQQQVAPQMHQIQMQHPQMMQQGGQYHQQQAQQHQQGQGQGHHQGPHHNQHHQQNMSIQQHPMMPRYPPIRDWPIRCVVEGKYQPVIVGPNGSTIKEIAHTCRCRVEFVNLSKKERQVLGNNDRVLTVHGHAEQASKAVARILEVIQVEALKDDENVGADIVLRLRAHNQLCGRLIGKQGSSIKEIMGKTGTNITVAKKNRYMEPAGGVAGTRHEELLSLMERTIVVRGPSIEAVVQAEAYISAKLKRCYESDSQMKYLQSQANIAGPIAPLPMGPPPQAGHPHHVQPAQMFPTANGVMQVQNFPPSHNPPTAANNFLQPGMIQINPGVVTLKQVRMWVPDSMIGALIGAKGRNIKTIIRESRAQVKIEAPEEKVAREAEEAEKKKQKEKSEEVEDTEAAGDHQEFLEDSATVTSADAIEEKPKSIPERLVTISGDDLSLLKAQSFVFAKMAETSTSLPANAPEFERIFLMRARTEVSVPTRIIGRIIGKGGQNVRELQRITGAIVKIPEEERHLEGNNPEGEEEMTLIRTFGNMHSSHNVQFRLSSLISDYYRSGEHRQRQGHGHGGRPAPVRGSNSQSASPLNQMGQLGQVPPISTSSNRTTPQSGGNNSQKSKSP